MTMPSCDDKIVAARDLSRTSRQNLHWPSQFIISSFWNKQTYLERATGPVFVAGSKARGLAAVRRILPIGRSYAPSTQAREGPDAPKIKFAPVHGPTIKVLDELKRARGQLERLGTAGT